jgi:hypothetical protein
MFNCCGQPDTIVGCAFFFISQRHDDFITNVNRLASEHRSCQRICRGKVVQHKLKGYDLFFCHLNKNYFKLNKAEEIVLVSGNKGPAFVKAEYSIGCCEYVSFAKMHFQ